MATPGEFIAALKDYVGVPYVLGGKTAKGLDCSGLITLALADVGVHFVHGSANQIAATSAISVDKAWRTPGALLYRPGHDAISLGNNKAIEAIRPRVAITNRTATLDGKPRFTRAGLITALSSTTGAAVSTMVSPFEGRYTSAYDPNRWITYNGKRIRSPHRGLDVAPPVAGTVGGAVRASFAGTVEEAVSWARPGNTKSTWAPGRTGNGCKIRNTDGAAQGYNHMRPVVRVGDRVKAGQVIGYLDRSGQITGPHLHFETWSNWRNPGSAFDPAILFNKYGVGIGSAPETSGGGTPAPPPEKEEYFDMDKKTFEAGLDAAFVRNSEYLIDKLFAARIKIAGNLAKALGVKTMNVSTILRHSAANLTEMRQRFNDQNSRLNAQNKVLKQIAAQVISNEEELREINDTLDERLPEPIEIRVQDLED